MTIRQLEYFMEVARSLSFSRAAERLFVSQPALSRSITALETELGVQLFNRDRHRVVLTSAGMVLAELLPGLGSDLSRIVAEVQQTDEGRRGRLRFGILDGIPMPDSLRGAWNYSTARYPLVELSPVCLCMEELIKGIKSGELDMILSYDTEWTTDTTLLNMPISSERFAVAVSRQHPLADLEQTDLKSLRKHIFFLAGTEQSFELHRWKEICTKQGFMPRFAMVINMPTLMLCIELGKGYAILPQSHILFDRPNIKKIALNEPFEVRIALKWSAANLNPCIDLFLDAFSPQQDKSFRFHG